MLVNERTRTVVARDVEVADTRRTRRKGLLGRDRLSPSSALVITRCWAIHTAFMRFDIDVIFVTREGHVVRVVRDLPPWRMAITPRADRVIEMAAGSLGETDVAVGDRLTIQPAAA
jgi:uncharacterized membrane protein (UPF0127 family)